ncbi:MAG: DNA-3-methyladenine glycosidase [uncultured bacterium]|nr:MAG: DNA-3-methyladenine glycosidase [uncultured bacterium]
MKLSSCNSIEIVPTSPFDFDSTFHKPSHFPSGDNLWEPGIRWQTYFWQDKQICLKCMNKGTVEKPLVHIEVYCSSNLTDAFINSLQEEMIYRYNLSIDLCEFYNLFKHDKDLEGPIKRFKGMRPGHAGSLYEYLIIGIVLQNTFVKRSVQMLQALFESYGTLLEFDGKQLWAFWKPGSLCDVSEEDLRKLKLGYRAKSIKKVDEMYHKNLVNEQALRDMDFETQKKELLQIYGVGPATVWYLLFDVFHRYDFFSHISPWEQKIYSKLFFNKDPENPVPVDVLLKYFEKFGKYKQLAVHYVWEDLWWKRKNESIPWLEKLIRL